MDEAFLAASVTVPRRFLACDRGGERPGSVARACDVPPADMHRLLRPVRRAPARRHAVSQGVNQSLRGTDKVNAILNCHLATGRIGKPGCGPFSITGQPNAMGGREVGGLANSLAAHLRLRSRGSATVSRRFWAAPRMATKPGPEGGGPVPRRRRTAGSRRSGSWRPTPPSSMPDAGAVREALRPVPVRGRLRRDRAHRHERRSPMSCCPRLPGARRTARSPIRNASSAGSAPSSRCPARRSPTGGSSPRSRAG